MFTGIIERLGTITARRNEGTNLHLTVMSAFTKELKIDQSLAHNGVCLTVIDIKGDEYTVTAIQETLQRSALGTVQVGDRVNLERAMQSGARLDGHMVQGHVDDIGHCISIEDIDGSWDFRFRYTPTPEHLLVDKGSVCINGVSLTVVNPIENEFSVAIIPYTFEHTTFGSLRVGDAINLEFDIIGKYIGRYMQAYRTHQF